MQRLLIVICLFVFLIVLTADSHGAIFVDDTWADGSRTNQNLPIESAWFTTSAANMAAYTNMLSITNLPTSSGQWSTYFTSPGNPVHLAVGETMTVTLAFKVTGSAVTNNSQNFRIGLYDSSAGTRLAADGSPNGTSYTGYALFSNFGSTWGRNTGLDHRKRNNTGAVSYTH